MKKSTLLFAFLFFSTASFAQLTEVLYKIQYNETTDHFDCKMYIENGIATSAADRLQLPAQFSIVSETGTTIAVEETFLPIFNNETYTGTIPMDWSIENSAIDPVEFPGYNVFSIVPNLGGQPSHYNNIGVENEVTLFSLSAIGGDICNISLRVFENFVDPNIIGGIDYTNSMMIGTTNEIFVGTDPPDGVNGDVDVTVNQGSICEGECITLTATFNCIFPGLEYEWSTDETTESITVCPEVDTEYSLHLFGPFEFSKYITSFISVDNGIFVEEDFLVTDLCVGVPIYYQPEYGIWATSDENIVTVTNDGYVTPISAGSAIISHTNELGNCLDEIVVTVLSPELPIILGDDIICANETTQLSPSTGVIWKSGNPAIATIDNTGLVTGVGLGATVFTYTTEEGCVSDPSPLVSVLIIPEPIITGPDTICMRAMTTLTPSAGVTWESSDPSVATIDNSGNVTGDSEGRTTFYFTDMANGCTSEESEPVTVLPSPIVELSADTVCQYTVVDATTNMEGGTWITTVISGSPNAAGIDHSGVIETDNPGVVSVQYISAEGCISDDSVLLTIFSEPNPQVSGNNHVCLGENILLSATSPPGANYSYEWTGPNGFSSTQMNIIIPNAEVNQSGEYILIASENGCVSNVIYTDVLVEDCDPCEDMNTVAEWIKIPVSMDIFAIVGDYEVAGSLVTGRELEDVIYFNNIQEEIILIKNNGEGYFVEEVVLFDLPYISSIVEIDIVDIDQDGLNDIVIYQPEVSGTNEPMKLTITIFKNLDNYSFENSLQFVEEDGLGYFISKRKYRDLDDQGFLDIIPFDGTVYFTDNWEVGSYQFPDNTVSVLIEDFNEDGLLDILGNDRQLFINNGDRTFSISIIDGFDPAISTQGLYDSETGLFNNGYISYVVTTGDNPSVGFCWDPGIFNSQCYFYANITSSSVESGIITAPEGFYVYETPLTCETSTEHFYEAILDFVPNEDGKIDFTGNGYSDFVTVEDGNIFVWINPNDQPKLRGTAFIDNNGDGLLNENDSPLRNVLISIEPGNLSVLTDDNGSYQFAVPEGTYTLTANVNEGEWIIDELTIENVEIAEPCNLGFDFGFVPDPTTIPMVNLSMVNTIARCDFETRFTITVENTGTEPLETQLQFDFDDKTTLFDVEFSGSTTVGNKVIADIGPLQPFQPQKYKIKVKMPNGSSVLPMLDFKASLVNEVGEIIAEYGYAEQLRCSYDPNDKREFPDREGDENLTLMDEDIEYTIRFQNNGNDTAYNVKIVDPLDGNIEPSSIRVVGSSHDVETCIEGTNLIFLFEDIYLVDSTTNYPSSQGYVTFKCNAKAGRAEFTAVNNTADIFFDTNLPIATNQTLNTLVSELCTDKSTIIDKYICDGEEYLGLTESGTYAESFDLVHGCDSMVTINLTVQGITYSQQSFDVCEEASITIGSEDYFIDSDITIIDTVTNDQGCISSILKYEFTVIPDLIDIEKFELCINEIGSVPTNLNGSWSVDDESIITINDQGTITTVNSGTAFLQYMDESGCIDEIQVEVFPEPSISNGGIDQICIDESNQLTSDTDGTWSSSDPEIATITNDGLVIGKDAGTVTFTFTSMSTGCSISTDMLILPSSDSNCIVSTNDISNESIKLYPNPATGSIYIESEEEWNGLRLINAQGQLVRYDFGDYQLKKQIDLSEVSSGLYFVVIEMESKVVFKKFVVD